MKNADMHDTIMMAVMLPTSQEAQQRYETSWRACGLSLWLWGLRWYGRCPRWCLRLPWGLCPRVPYSFVPMIRRGTCWGEWRLCPTGFLREAVGKVGLALI